MSLSAKIQEHGRSSWPSVAMAEVGLLDGHCYKRVFKPHGFAVPLRVLPTLKRRNIRAYLRCTLRHICLRPFLAKGRAPPAVGDPSGQRFPG